MSLVILLKHGASELGISLSPKQTKQFMSYHNLIKKWNRKINLTSITDDTEIVIKHFIDSLTVSGFVQDGSQVLDIGTGAGFPGIPLAIVNETLNITVLDAREKRIFFINEVLRELEIANVMTAFSRAEDTDNKIKRNYFDYVLTRAVGNIDEVLSISTPYVKDSGRIILMRGKDGKSEWEDFNNINYKLLNVAELNLPGTDFKRVLLEIKKE